MENIVGSDEELRRESPIVARVSAATGFDKAEPRVWRDVFGHPLMRIEAQFGEAESSRFGFGQFDEPASETLALSVAANRDVVEEQMVRLR